MDMASLVFKLDPNTRFFSVLSPKQELLATIELTDNLSKREGIFLLLDAALAGARVHRVFSKTKVRLKLALYNPLTAEVSIGATPDSKTYSAKVPLALPADGLYAQFVDSNELQVEGLSLFLVDRSATGVSRIFKTHS